MPQWHVLGAGAMGCLWAARLHEAAGRKTGGARLLLRDAVTLSRYRRASGLCLEQEGQERLLAVPADVVGQHEGGISHLLLATKCQDALPALASVARALNDQTIIVLLQNGVSVQEQIAAQFGGHRVFCLSTSHGAWLRQPFHVVHAGRGQAWLGSLDAAAGASHLPALLSALPADALRIGQESHMRERLWRKFAINCAINALTVIHDCRNGELLIRPAARRQLLRLCREIGDLLEALPEAPPPDDVAEAALAVLDTTAGNVSSMLQDVRQGRSTEIAYLNGWLCELADRHGLPCPENRAVLHQLMRSVHPPAGQ